MTKSVNRTEEVGGRDEQIARFKKALGKNALDLSISKENIHVRDEGGPLCAEKLAV